MKESTNLTTELDFYQEMRCIAVLNGKYILVVGGSAVYEKDSGTSSKIRIYSVDDPTIIINAVSTIIDRIIILKASPLSPSLGGDSVDFTASRSRI